MSQNVTAQQPVAQPTIDVDKHPALRAPCEAKPIAAVDAAYFEPFTAWLAWILAAAGDEAWTVTTGPKGAGKVSLFR